MSPYPQTVTLFSRDSDLCDRIRPLLSEKFDLQLCDSFYEFSRLLDRGGPGVILLDIRLPEDAPELDIILEQFPHHLFLVLGTLTSTPMQQPAIQRVHGILDLREPTTLIANRVSIAQEFLDLKEENRKLTREADEARSPIQTESSTHTLDNVFSVRELIRIMRSMDNVAALQERLLEEISAVMHLSRAGIALRRFRENSYTVCAGWMLSPEAKDCVFEADDYFIRWFENHPRLVTRSGITHLDSTREQIMLNRVLDRLGAEIIVPLRGKNGLIGWFFSSYALNGKPFNEEKLDQLILISDLMAVSLERALLYQEVSLQKTLAETLINALPVGIIYADAHETIRWCSPTTQAILGGDNPDKTGKPIQSLGPHLYQTANLLSQSEDDAPITREWTDPSNGRPLRATAISIRSQNRYSGILMTVQDRTHENAIQDKQDRLERGLFWNQLASSMSHEVRNPLVTIKTFAQLLPDRYQDPEFRAEFSELVGHEINRLTAMIDQLNEFAHPRELSLIKMDVRQALQFAWVNFQKDPPYTPLPDVTDEIESCLPDILADLNALTHTIEHILLNAAEALENRKGSIHVTLKNGFDLQCGETVEIGISDNGPGIQEDLRDHIFSPFCSKKARGLGLGLPIAQRTMADHNGKIEITSNPRGTQVRLILPAFKMGAST
ncbi:ATP-binding protein [Kiritimatiellaeota bacterium B1221]|nr:ATP-binding protein [Kiritimatiellaeota bacterium B1221]